MRWNYPFFLLLVLYSRSVKMEEKSSYISLNVTLHWPNYLLPVKTADGVYRNLIVDTGNAQLTFLSRNFNATKDKKNKYITLEECLVLQEVYTLVKFFNPSSGACQSYHGKIAIGDAASFVNFTTAANVSAQNSLLHPWSNTKVSGDIGLSYCNSATGTCSADQSESAFVQILKNASSPIAAKGGGYNSLFGLDFLPNSTKDTSSIQLGGVKPMYDSSMVWARQATDSPTYHEVLITSLSMCGKPLLSSVGVSSWPVIVDTGFACIGLPAEIYDMFSVWLDVAPETSADLPALTFVLEEGSSNSNHVFYVPLSTLLVNSTYFIAETGAPMVTIGGVKSRMCVLRGGSSASSPAPRITLGTLALQSLYFAANFSAYSVGFASKVDPAVLLDHMNHDVGRCNAAAMCTANLAFNQVINSCTPPACSEFFFTTNKDGECVYKSTTYGAGLFIVIIIILMECVIFFVTQFSALEILHVRERHSLAISKVDFITRWIGKFLTGCMDGIVQAAGLVRTDRQGLH